MRPDHARRLSVIIPVHNEESVIARKLENTLALDYPRESLEILFVSDGSTRRVEKFSKAGTHLLGWGGLGSGPGQFQLPFGIAVDPSGSSYRCGGKTSASLRSPHSTAGTVRNDEYGDL